MIPAFAFAAYSGTGKTTLLEAVIRALKAHGLRVCAIKQDAHHIEIDREGKDSWRFAQAGADMTIVSGPEVTAVVEHRTRTLRDNLAMAHDVDLILVEGYHCEEIPRIGICRRAAGRGLPDAPERFAAIVTDDPSIGGDCPHFALDDVQGICAFLIEQAARMCAPEISGGRKPFCASGTEGCPEDGYKGCTTQERQKR